jgi:GNAT superfamily N-acetyltransferase
MFTHRLATRADLARLATVVSAAIDQLQKCVLTPDQVAASHTIMGIDTQLIDDGTYFVVEAGECIAGCGGWSRRTTLYGASHSAGRDDALLDPATQPARVRAMYTHPDFARRGVGRRILSLCEAAATAEGFHMLELMATMAGLPLYTACGFQAVEFFDDTSSGIAIPLVRMTKSAGHAARTPGADSGCVAPPP